MNTVQSSAIVHQESSNREPVTVMDIDAPIATGTNSSSTIVRPPIEENIPEPETTEHGRQCQSSSNYRPRPIRTRKRMEFPGSGKHFE